MRVAGRGGRDEHDELPAAVGTFMRGLSLGALVGAAIAGSALLERARRRSAERPAPHAVEARTTPLLDEPGRTGRTSGP